jgi:hypothetical protein
MKHLSLGPGTRPLLFRLTLIGLAMGALPASRAFAEPERSAPVDAQCPWGRLADGRGRLVRCLTSEEAARLREPPPAPPRTPTESKVPPGAASEAPKAPALSGFAPAEPGKPPLAPSSTADGNSGAIWPLPAPKAPEAPPAAPPAPPPPAEELTAEIGPVVVDSGTLSDSQHALRKARDRFVECAEKNGGLSAERADVELRFLVQERGRAEGVSLKKRRGLGDAAAKCIADVVDRRFVGYPEEPAVGATLVVTITKKKK